MNTAGHYTVVEGDYFRTRETVAALKCSHCGFRVAPRDYKRAGDRSGQPRYNRARAVMVKHLHAQHRAALSPASTASGPSNPSPEKEEG